VLPDAKIVTLPPCTDLTTFLDVVVNYDMPLRLVRHSSQGDTKFAKETVDEINAILNCRPDVEIHMMPGPSFVPPTDRFIKYHRNVPPVSEFLSLGNCFYYSLPKGYQDMGPRVILEAMASGMPVIADAWGGAVDRVTPETGWLCESKEQFVEIIKGLDSETLKRKGEAAREQAKKEFVADRWIKEILGEEFSKR